MWNRLAAALVCLPLVAGCHAAAAPRLAARAPGTAPTAMTTEIATIDRYVQEGWRTLRRSNQDLLKAAIDPKHPPANGRWPVYISAKDDAQAIEKSLRQELSPQDFAQLEIRQLGLSAPTEHGILYLPHPYVVPGGRFNEMYGWDSYFIIMGLLRDNETQMALDMVNNHLYEVEHYGTILNANRSYYLTRSHPPFLTRSVMAVYERTHDTAWLAAALPTVERFQNFWRENPRMTDTGLSRYYDSGKGPAPEVVSSEIDAEGQGHYDRVRAYYRTHDVPDYKLDLYYDKAQDKLTDLFFRADRAMRESGFDPSGRFGPFNAGVLEFNPVCLNTLLYQQEVDLAAMHGILGHQKEVVYWGHKASHRAERINQLMWDDKAGMYFDYDFIDGVRRNYPFATTFYPLWAGLASPEQAARLVANLSQFEAPGGLLTSLTRSGTQWDAPYGWAPLQMIAIEGLRRYGYIEEAERISVAYLAMIARDFRATHAIFEKYDVVERRSDVEASIKFGYSTNVFPFGMSNGVFNVLYDSLSDGAKAKLAGLLASQPAERQPSQSQ